MTKETIIQKTIHAINILPQQKAEEVSDFAEFLLKQFEEYSLKKGIEKITSDSDSFNFLNEEESIYSKSDLKEKF